MNGDDRYANHDARINRLEATLEQLLKRIDEQFGWVRESIADLRADFREQRKEIRWIFGVLLGIMIALHGATLALLMRAQGLL